MKKTSGGSKGMIDILGILIVLAAAMLVFLMAAPGMARSTYRNETETEASDGNILDYEDQEAVIVLDLDGGIYSVDGTMSAVETQAAEIEYGSETEAETENEEQSTQENMVLTHESFYGIWCMASKNETDANKSSEEMRRQGFDAQIFRTSDWSNLSSEDWFVVSAGLYSDETSAQQALSDVQKYYPNAYIKYSGEWIAE